MKKTPLYEEHLKLGAKIVPFAGWDMPVLYSGVIAEHNAVRNAAGLFDVSHMGQIFFEGKDAELLLEELTCNKVSKIKDGKALYSAITNEAGGVIDDIIIYRITSGKYLLCVNASNVGKDFSWFTDRNNREVRITNRSGEFALIAIQGPMALAILKNVKGGEGVGDISTFHFKEINIEGVSILAARTGYTGEDGFELFLPSNSAPIIWNILLETGKERGLIPCGLGARDSLRLEACYPLHGHELSPEISAVESGLAWIVKLDKPDYPGKKVFEKELREGVKRTLAAFAIEEGGIAREGAEVISKEGKVIGFVTSGTKTPTLNKALGLALIDTSRTELGSELGIKVRDKILSAQVVKKPFYKRG